MYEDVLGIDLGTNSIGWAIVRKYLYHYELLHKGVHIFPMGVTNTDKGEVPSVQERTHARALRRLYFRRRLRKIEILKVLIEYTLCPFLTQEQLLEWKLKKKYPLSEEFLKWQRTDDNIDKNPYHDRHICLTQKLNLENENERYILGRALYHLCQRRGFLSNRKANSRESDGEVKTSISNLSKEIENSGYKYIGEYFYFLYKRGEKIRGKYTARDEHYRKEFNAICDMQELSVELVTKLERAIFFQRPLKSQKGLVGKCSFEKNKSRCPLSHPRFEEFRMLSFINNIKIKTMNDNNYRPLDESEIKLIIPLFHRKAQFEFEDIAKAIAGKKVNYGFKDDKADVAYRFNYKMTTNVSGCPVTSGLIGVFGNDWLNEICSVYQKGENKTQEEILNDIWHVLFSFDNNQKLEEWGRKYLQLTDEQVKKFITISIPQGYASLSLNAINKSLVYLHKGLRYDESIMLANIKSILPQHILNNNEYFTQIESDLINTITDFVFDPDNPKRTKPDAIREYLEDIVERKKLDKIYHPSMIETYPNAVANKDGVVLLGSPRTSSIRNPMAMRALFQLRHLINQLIKEGKINQYTKVNIEFSRNLNDANKRKAIASVQTDNNKKRTKAIKEIQNHFKTQHNIEYTPSENEILKYLLWEEQNHRCIYTGTQIDISDFVGANPKYDIEHTVPRSRGGDDSQLNKTLCESRFNREIKQAKLPSELSNYDEIMAHVVQQGWETKIKDLEKQISRIKTSSANNKVSKDKMIVERHKLRMDLDYWRGKYERFTMKEVPIGFSNRQGVDIGIIGRYARMYLGSYFNKYINTTSRSIDIEDNISSNKQIFTIKGATTAEFRVMWGLQEEYTKKERINHVHHCIDAIVIACIDRAQYQKWATYKQNLEISQWNNCTKPIFEKPWKTFTEDVKAISNSILVSHYTADNMPRKTKKALRIRGKIQRNVEGKIKYQQGDTARGALHNDKFYGAIKKNDNIHYVIRKRLSELSESDVSKIVDEVVKEKVSQAIAERGFKNAFAEPVWMNKEKNIEIKKVRIFVKSTNPIHLKKHRDLSDKDYKLNYYVTNKNNYCLAIYEGIDNKGNTKRSYKIVSNLEAAKKLKLNARKNDVELVPLSDKNDNPLKYFFKIGTMVLFYENSSSEIIKCNISELHSRLYKITGINIDPTGNGYGCIVLTHSSEARSSSEFSTKKGKWKIGEDLRPSITLRHTQFNALVEGFDFELTTTGEIIFK